MAEHKAKLEAAIIEVGLAGGGKVVVPHPNPRLEIIKVLKDQNEDTLPRQRIEYRVPAGSVFRG